MKFKQAQISRKLAQVKSPQVIASWQSNEAQTKNEALQAKNLR